MCSPGVTSGGPIPNRSLVIGAIGAIGAFGAFGAFGAAGVLPHAQEKADRTGGRQARRSTRQA